MKQTENLSDLINVRLIFDYMRENSLSEAKFCKLCNVSVYTFRKIVSGQDFDIIALFRIAKRMNLPIHMFFNDGKSNSQVVE